MSTHNFVIVSMLLWFFTLFKIPQWTIGTIITDELNIMMNHKKESLKEYTKMLTMVYEFSSFVCYYEIPILYYMHFAYEYIIHTKNNKMMDGNVCKMWKCIVMKVLLLFAKLSE